MIVGSASIFTHSGQNPDNLPPITGGEWVKVPLTEGGTSTRGGQGTGASFLRLPIPVLAGALFRLVKGPVRALPICGLFGDFLR